jgi:hypothetical protein
MAVGGRAARRPRFIEAVTANGAQSYISLPPFSAMVFERRFSMRSLGARLAWKLALVALAAVGSSPPVGALEPQGPVLTLPGTWGSPLGVLPTEDDGYLAFWTGVFKSLRSQSFDSGDSPIQPQTVLGRGDSIQVVDEPGGFRRFVWSTGFLMHSQRVDRRGRRVGATAEFRVKGSPVSYRPEMPCLVRMPDGSGLVFWFRRGLSQGLELRGRAVDTEFRPRGEEFSVASLQTQVFADGGLSCAAGEDGRVLLALSLDRFVSNRDRTELIVWNLAPGSRRAIRMTPSPAGSVGHDQHQSGPQLVTQVDGTFLLAWERHHEAPLVQRVEARQLDSSGGPLGPIVRITPNGEQEYAPRLVARSTGGAVLATTRGVPARIVAQELQSDGQPIGGVVRIDDPDAGLTSGSVAFLGQRADDPDAPLWVVWLAYRGTFPVFDFAYRARRVAP